MIKRRFIVEVAVNEKTVARKYPNYDCNYDTPDELIDAIMLNFKFEADTDMSKNGMKEWGYSKKIIEEIKA